MDLIRASIKCLFNDYPLETAFDAICGKINSVQDFLKPFPFVVQVRERNGYSSENVREGVDGG